jgi:hypothetical protein
VKAKAARRVAAAIEDLVFPALDLLGAYIQGAEDDATANVRLAAARDILDRAGYGAKTKLELEGHLTTESEVDRALADALAEFAAASALPGAALPARQAPGAAPGPLEDP